MNAARQSSSATSLRARIHIAKKDLGMRDDEYVALLEANTGKSSTAEMSDNEMAACLRALVRVGWKPAPTKASQQTQKQGGWMSKPANWDDVAKNPMYRKTYALICANKAHGWNWGYVRGTAKKMFESRKGETVVLEWLTGAELHALVSALQIQSNRLAGRQT